MRICKIVFLNKVLKKALTGNKVFDIINFRPEVKPLAGGTYKTVKSGIIISWYYEP